MNGEQFYPIDNPHTLRIIEMPRPLARGLAIGTLSVIGLLGAATSADASERSHSVYSYDCVNDCPQPGSANRHPRSSSKPHSYSGDQSKPWPVPKTGSDPDVPQGPQPIVTDAPSPFNYDLDEQERRTHANGETVGQWACAGLGIGGILFGVFLLVRRDPLQPDRSRTPRPEVAYNPNDVPGRDAGPGDSDITIGRR